MIEIQWPKIYRFKKNKLDSA